MKGGPFAGGHSARGRGGIMCNPRLVLLTTLSLGSPVVPTSCALCLHGRLNGRLDGSGPRVTSCPLLRPSGASKVTVSGSHQSRRTARMVAGAPGPTSGHVHGHAGAECDPVAETVTIPCEYAWLGWAQWGPPLLRPEGLGEEGTGGQRKGEGPLQVAVPSVGEDPALLGRGGAGRGNHSRLGLTSWDGFEAVIFTPVCRSLPRDLGAQEVCPGTWGPV